MVAASSPKASSSAVVASVLSRRGIPPLMACMALLAAAVRRLPPNPFVFAVLLLPMSVFQKQDREAIKKHFDDGSGKTMVPAG